VKHAPVSLILVLLSVSAPAVRAQEAGDRQRGLSLARQVCSECHAIEVQQVKSPNPRAPTFPELASTPGMTNAALTVALTTPHAGMPMFRLTAEQRADIIAYVLGLRQGGSPPGK
jgi:mono/diheme cytochrome c family protein